MNLTKLERVRAAKAAEVCQGLDLAEQAQSLLLPEQTPAQFLAALEANRQFVAALEFLAFALPRREAVWWACVCLEAATGAALPAVQSAALRAAVRWVLEPNEERRQAAYAPAQAAKLTTPGGGVAMAAFWSGGSVLPPGHAGKATPAPILLPQGVRGAVLRAAALVGHERTTHCHRQFLALGVGIANGQYLWTSGGA